MVVKIYSSTHISTKTIMPFF